MWKGRSLSAGGRAVLLKSVLYALPVYFLSFFKAPTGIISTLESLFKQFLWGGDLDSRKVNWIKWDKVCKDREVGGLGIKNLRAFNLALLGKWIWRMQEERQGMWYTVLAHKYGIDGRDLVASTRDSSSWWKDVTSVDEGAWGFHRNWFSNTLGRRVGNGLDTRFWEDPWCVGGALKNRFGRLYSISRDKNATVANLRKQTDNGWQWEWNWRRNLFEWEEELVAQLIEVVQNTVLKETERDRWIWKEEETEVYSVKTAYRILMKNYEDVGGVHQKAWHKLIPLKVAMFVWRLLQNRVPTKDSLIKRGIIGIDHQFCPAGCQELESVNHLFFGCHSSYKVWMEILRWTGIVTAMHIDSSSHLEQFEGLLYCSGETKLKFMVIWFACIWAIWKARNKSVFKSKPLVVEEIVEDVKLSSWNWLKAKIKSFQHPISQWFLNPIACLGVNMKT